MAERRRKSFRNEPRLAAARRQPLRLVLSPPANDNRAPPRVIAARAALMLAVGCAVAWVATAWIG